MRTRNYSVLSTAADMDAGAELEFLQELEDAIEAMGSSRFTVDGRPATVAEETRARLGETIKELTQPQIAKIADGAEKFGNKDQRVLLEVVQGDDERPDAQLKFPEADVTAQYIYYNEEQKEDARLLQELKRIQYLQNVVMKQLEMTDRSGSTQVVQGMIASGQKFVAGLTAVFKQVETLSKQIEKGLHNKADMPTAEQKTAAIASITQALRALPAVDPRHIAVKNMVMQQVERLQAKFNMVPTAPRASATILQMKAPQANADAKVDAKVDTKIVAKGDAKVDVKTVAKADAKVDVKADAKTAPVVQTKVDAKAAPVADAKSTPVAKGQPATPVAKADAKAAPVAKTDAKVAPQTKVEAKATVVAKADAAVKADVKGAAPTTQAQTQAQAKLGVTAPTETMRQMSATITSIAPNVTAAQAAARVGNTSPVAALQATLAKALGITPATATLAAATPAAVAPVQVARVASAPIASMPVSTIASVAPVAVAAAVQSAPVAVQAQAAPVQAAPAQVVQAPVQQAPVAQAPVAQVQVQPTNVAPTSAPITAAPTTSQLSAPPSIPQTGVQTGAPIVVNHPPVNPAAGTPTTAAPTTVAPTNAPPTAPAGVMPTNVAPVVQTNQPPAAPPNGQPANVQPTNAAPVEAPVKPMVVSNTATQVEARGTEQQDAKETQARVDGKQQEVAKTGFIEKAPNQKEGAENVKDKFKANVQSACDSCGTKDCANCGVKTSTLFGVKTSSIPIIKNIPESVVQKAKSLFKINAGGCADCTNGGNCGSCMRTKAVDSAKLATDVKSFLNNTAAAKNSPAPK